MARSASSVKGARRSRARCLCMLVFLALLSGSVLACLLAYRSDLALSPWTVSLAENAVEAVEAFLHP